MTKTMIAIWVVVILATVASVCLWINRPRNVVVEANLSINFPVAGFSHGQFEELLQTYVSADGRVDYDRWASNRKSVEQLNSYLAAIRDFSPVNTPNRFPKRNDDLAYWIYGYNAYVIKSVLDNWPIKSVTDIKAPIEAVKGLGFFHQLRFSFGGEYLSLLAVENERIRKQHKDARIHFVLNCASNSCPIARPELPTGDDLERLLILAASEFINDPSNVQVDHQEKIVYLSTIFKWYEEDFIQDMRISRGHAGNGLIDYVKKYASGKQLTDLASATEYAVQFREYDWALNNKK